MLYAVKDAEGNFNGVTYSHKNDDIEAHHALYSETLEAVEGLIKQDEKDEDGKVVSTTYTATQESNTTKIAKIKMRLNEIDLESIRPLRAVQEGSQDTSDTDKLSALESEAENLRAQLAGLV